MDGDNTTIPRRLVWFDCFSGMLAYNRFRLTECTGLAWLPRFLDSSMETNLNNRYGSDVNHQNFLNYKHSQDRACSNLATTNDVVDCEKCMEQNFVHFKYYGRRMWVNYQQILIKTHCSSCIIVTEKKSKQN